MVSRNISRQPAILKGRYYTCWVLETSDWAQARPEGVTLTDLQLLTVEDLCSLLRVSPAAIYSQRHRGEMPGSLGAKLGKRIFFRPGDIEDYIESQLPDTLPIPR